MGIVPRLCDCCGEAVGLIVSVFLQLDGFGFNLEPLLESVWHVAAD